MDDESGVVVSGQLLLEQFGYTISSTTSPRRAVELFSASPKAFDLVLTDLTMPEMTGLELAEQLRKIRPDIPILLCTGLASDVTLERLQAAGITEMVMKPMVASELSQAVHRALHP